MLALAHNALPICARPQLAMRHNWTHGSVDATQWPSGALHLLGFRGEPEDRPILCAKPEGWGGS